MGQTEPECLVLFDLVRDDQCAAHHDAQNKRNNPMQIAHVAPLG